MTKRLLIAYSMTSTYVPTTLDYLLDLRNNLGYDTQFLHVTHNAIVGIKLDDYDIVLQNYCCRLCFDEYVSKNYLDLLRNFKGLKVLAVQDEYDRTDTLKQAIKDLGFQIVLTCVPQSYLAFVYPPAEFPGVEFVTVFTGYISDSIQEDLGLPKKLADRSIFIGYRGRDIGGRYGQLGFDKYEIGRRTKAECDARGIATNIAMDESSRIYGRAWYKFIGDCRAMLGSESGSNVFDFDGSIEKRYIAMAAANGGRPPSYAEFCRFVADREREVDMGQISPRVFECAALRTPMILYRGRYSDAITPGAHYLALEKDFSNIDDVLSQLNNISELEAMVERTYQHIVASGAFSYGAYARRLRQCFDERLNTRGSRQTQNNLGTQAIAQSEPQTPAERKLIRLLTEFPTQDPQSLEAFNIKQARRIAVTHTERIVGLDSIYSKGLADMLHASEHIYNNYKNVILTSRPKTEHNLTVIEKRACLTRSVAKLNGHRAEYTKKYAYLAQEYSKAISEQRLSDGEHIENDKEALEGLWIIKYSECYAGCAKSFEEFCQATRTAIDEFVSSSPNTIPNRLRWQIQVVKLELARINGSKLAIAKAILGRSSTLVKLARMVRRYRGRFRM